MVTSPTVGCAIDARCADLCAMIRTHLDHRILVLRAQLQQGERHTNVVIEISLVRQAPISQMAPTISLVVVFPLLPVMPRTGPEKALALRTGTERERFKRVRHHDLRHGNRQLTLDAGRRRLCPRRPAQKSWAVEAFSLLGAPRRSAPAGRFRLETIEIAGDAPVFTNEARRPAPHRAGASASVRGMTVAVCIREASARIRVA